MTDHNNARCGYVAIVGRPNVGKSTLLNSLVGEKVSIVSAKAHTTRHRILGVLNHGPDQLILIDTPGLQHDRKHALHRLMAKTINQAIADADVVVMMAEATKFTARDRELAELLRARSGTTILALNKVDLIDDKSELLPLLEQLGTEYEFGVYLPISARKQSDVAHLVVEILRRLPVGPPMFPRDMVTDRSQRFRIAEIIREKLLKFVHQEVPYGLTVEVEHVGRKDEQVLVHAVIWLERASHKAIVISKGGRVLKATGRAARLEVKNLLGERVHLELWVKVREKWADSEHELRRLGFDIGEA